METSLSHSETGSLHKPVLCREVAEYLAPEPGGIYVDCTVGLGGHASFLLKNFPGIKKIIGFDCDMAALKKAALNLKPFGDRVHLVNSSYTEIPEMLAAENINKVNGFLLDAGLSSFQLDYSGRGFSFRRDEPLDMRMNMDSHVTAADMVNHLTEESLADIIKIYGEERWAKKIASRIVEHRQKKPLLTSAELGSLVYSAIPRRFHSRRIHPATRTFQALRIAVNRELDNLKEAVNRLPEHLEEGGRFCVISFHSLEDRIVKHSFRNDDRLEVLTKRPVMADEEERMENPRARSAKLRCAQLKGEKAL